jgi:hypothetical protein
MLQLSYRAAGHLFLARESLSLATIVFTFLWRVQNASLLYQYHFLMRCILNVRTLS